MRMKATQNAFICTDHTFGIQSYPIHSPLWHQTKPNNTISTTPTTRSARPQQHDQHDPNNTISTTPTTRSARPQQHDQHDPNNTISTTPTTRSVW